MSVCPYINLNIQSADDKKVVTCILLYRSYDIVADSLGLQSSLPYSNRKTTHLKVRV